MLSLTTLALAVTFRAVAAILGAGAARSTRRILWRSVFQATAAWLLVLAAQAVVPVWPLILGTVLATAFQTRCRGAWVAASSDLMLLAIMASTSQSGIEAGTLALEAVTLLAVGQLLDRAVRLMPFIDRLIMKVPARGLGALRNAVAVGAVIIVTMTVWDHGAKIWGHWKPLAYVAISLPYAGEKVLLPTGSIAWRRFPIRRHRDTGVLLLHGANSAGASQSTQIALRAALLDAGYPVLALDAMGYGASPAPSDMSKVEHWDELPHVAAAMRYMRNQFHVSRIVVIGHSEGCQHAIRSLKLDPAPDKAILIGPAMVAELGREEYWYKRFHANRQLPMNSIPLSTYRQIETAFYSGRSNAKSLDPSHSPILLVHAEIDYQDVKKTRIHYASVLQGNFSEIELAGATHYLNTMDLKGVVVARDVPWIRNLVVLDSALVRHLKDVVPGWIEG